MVFDTAVIEDVGTDLAAPLYLFLASLYLLLLCHLLFQGTVVELGTEQTEGIFTILLLFAGFSILDEDFLFFACVGVNVLVTKTYTCFDLVHVLATGTAAAEGVPGDFALVDDHFDAVVNQRSDKDTGKGSHTLALCIVGRNTYQTVHTAFALEESVSLVAFNLHCHRLDACFITVLEIADGDFVFMGFCPTLVHTHQHTGPVLCLCAASSRIDFQHSIHTIGLALQHILQFKVFNQAERFGIIVIHLLLCGHFVSVEVESHLGIVGCRLHSLVAVNPFLQALHFLHLLFSGLLVVPETRCLGTQFLFLHFDEFCINVEVTVQGFSALFNVF